MQVGGILEPIGDRHHLETVCQLDGGTADARVPGVIGTPRNEARVQLQLAEWQLA